MSPPLCEREDIIINLQHRIWLEEFSVQKRPSQTDGTEGQLPLGHSGLPQALQKCVSATKKNVIRHVLHIIKLCT